jgi:hypothetical protein
LLIAVDQGKPAAMRLRGQGGLYNGHDRCDATAGRNGQVMLFGDGFVRFGIRTGPSAAVTSNWSPFFQLLVGPGGKPAGVHGLDGHPQFLIKVRTAANGVRPAQLLRPAQCAFQGNVLTLLEEVSIP